MIIRNFSSSVLASVLFFSGVAISISSCSEEILDGVKDEEEAKKDVNPGTPQRTYSLDWEIKNPDRQKTVLADLAGGQFKSECDQIIFE